MTAPRRDAGRETPPRRWSGDHCEAAWQTLFGPREGACALLAKGRGTLRFFAAYNWQWPRMGSLADEPVYRGNRDLCAPVEAQVADPCCGRAGRRGNLLLLQTAEADVSI